MAVYGCRRRMYIIKFRNPHNSLVYLIRAIYLNTKRIHVLYTYMGKAKTPFNWSQNGDLITFTLVTACVQTLGLRPLTKKELGQIVNGIVRPDFTDFNQSSRQGGHDIFHQIISQRH